MKRNIPFSPPDITQEEIDSVVETLKSGWITTGPKTKLFEKRVAKYCNSNMAVALNSATACMEMTLRLLGVGPGDEVITSAYTYTASASVIHHVGAKVILVDTAENSFEMDYEQLEKKITKKTKVIIPVDIAGIMCDYDKIYEIVNRKKEMFSANNKLQEKYNRVIILADAAHSFGATYKNKVSGSVADFTSFSFHAVKNLTTGEGGAVTWNPIPEVKDSDIYKEFMLLGLHGQSKDALEKSKLGSWEYDILAPNYKCNMTDIMASIGLIQLNRYSQLLSERKIIIEQYDKLLEGNSKIKKVSHYTDHGSSSGHLYLLRIDGYSSEQRNDLINFMAENGIATNVHYKPLPLLTAYKNLGFTISEFPNSFKQFENEITLPLHTLLTKEDVDFICNTLHRGINVC